MLCLIRKSNQSQFNFNNPHRKQLGCWFTAAPNSIDNNGRTWPFLPESKDISLSSSLSQTTSARVQVVPAQGHSEWEYNSASGSVGDLWWLSSTDKRLQWDLNVQWAFRKKRSPGTHVTMHYVKALMLSIFHFFFFKVSSGSSPWEPHVSQLVCRHDFCLTCVHCTIMDNRFCMLVSYCNIVFCLFLFFLFYLFQC